MNRRTKRAALALGSLALIAALAPVPLAPDEAGDLRKLALSRAEVCKKIADFYADRRLAPPVGEKQDPGMSPLGEQVEIWTRRNVDARLDAATSRDERVAILVEEVERTKAIEARIKELFEGEPGLSRIDGFKAEFFRLDAEYRLAKEKAGR